MDNCRAVRAALKALIFSNFSFEVQITRLNKKTKKKIFCKCHLHPQLYTPITVFWKKLFTLSSASILLQKWIRVPNSPLQNLKFEDNNNFFFFFANRDQLLVLA